MYRFFNSLEQLRSGRGSDRCLRSKFSNDWEMSPSFSYKTNSALNMTSSCDTVSTPLISGAKASVEHGTNSTRRCKNEANHQISSFSFIRPPFSSSNMCFSNRGLYRWIQQRRQLTFKAKMRPGESLGNAVEKVHVAATENSLEGIALTH